MPNSGRSRVQHALDHRHGIVAGRRRVAGAVRQEHALGVQRQHILGGGGGGQHGHLAARRGEAAQDVALGAVVDGDDAQARALPPLVALRARPTASRPSGRIGRRSRPWRGRARQGRARRGPWRPAPRCRICPSGSWASATCGAPCWRIARVRRRVSTPPMPMRPLEVSQCGRSPGRAPVRRLGRVPFHDQAGGDGIGGLVILGGDADIADMGEGEGHDLARHRRGRS